MPLHRELTFGDSVPSMGSTAADLAAARLTAPGGAVPSRWVAEDSSQESDDDNERGDERQLNGDREHAAHDSDLEDVSLLLDGQLERGQHMNGNGHHHANGHHHGGLNGMSREDGSDEEDDGLNDDIGAAKGKETGRLPRAASKGRLVQVGCWTDVPRPQSNVQGQSRGCRCLRQLAARRSSSVLSRTSSATNFG